MNKKTEYLIEKIFDKFKKIKTKEINLEKYEFNKFIFFLLDKN